jgi:peptide/nickel transport system permease protein
MSSLLRRLLRDKMAFAGLVILLVFAIIAIFAPLLANHPDEIYDTFLMERLQPPSAEHWFGTDRVGADVYSRLLFGTRITLFTALAGVAASMLIGVPLGLLAGFMDGLAGGVVPRVADIFLSIPQVILAIAIAQTLGPSVFNVILALSVTFWPWFTRLVAAETRALRRELFVEASVALGASPLRVMVFHVLPNLASPLIVRTTLSMGFAILTAAALGFLGLGAQAPSPEWGRTIAESREYLPEAWWYALAPGLAIFLVVMGFNLFGDGLRDVLDPRLRRSVTRKPASAAYKVAAERVAAE